jgi:hypothetical protein
MLNGSAVNHSTPAVIEGAAGAERIFVVSHRKLLKRFELLLDSALKPTKQDRNAKFGQAIALLMIAETKCQMCILR